MADWIRMPFGVMNGVGRGMSVLDGVVIGVVVGVCNCSQMSYHNFSIFRDGGRRHLGFFLGRIWYLVIFITVQNLVTIDAVVSKI